MTLFATVCDTIEARIAELKLDECAYVATIGSHIIVSAFCESETLGDARSRLRQLAIDLQHTDGGTGQVRLQLVKSTPLSGALVGLPRYGRRFEIFGPALNKPALVVAATPMELPQFPHTGTPSASSHVGDERAPSRTESTVFSTGTAAVWPDPS
jgi:hypothetical protein